MAFYYSTTIRLEAVLFLFDYRDFGDVCVNGHHRIAVQDTGIGIAKEELPHIFERFYRVDKSRARISGGSGIGLTISKHIIQAHGGRIWAESDGLGHGCRVTFSLPLPTQASNVKLK